MSMNFEPENPNTPTQEHTSCKNFSWEGIYLYLDGRVSQAQRQLIDEHIRKCIFCNDCKELEETIRTLLKITVPTRCPCELLEAIQQKIQTIAED